MSRSGSLSRCARPTFKYPSVFVTFMMIDMAADKTTTVSDYRPRDRIREKFHELFGSECALRDDALIKRYTLSPDGDLIIFIR